jgi:hypothetical protein
MDLLGRSGWPTAAAIAAVVGRDRSTIAEHLRNPRFDAWFNEQLVGWLERSRPKADAKFVALAMAGSVPHYEHLGWSKARRGPVTTVATDGTVTTGASSDGPAVIVIKSLIPRPPPRPAP